MFKNKIKGIISKLAEKAVAYAQDEFSELKGSQKKVEAIAYLVNILPLPIFLKPIAGKLLSEIIDQCIEFAVIKMKANAETLV